MPKPEYTEFCSDCIHYTETSYMFGQCKACQHEVSCNAICTQFAERQISPDMLREAEKVPVVVEKAGTVTNGDRIRAMTDEELADFLLDARSICRMCRKRDETCGGAFHECFEGIEEWLKQVAQNE